LAQASPARGHGVEKGAPVITYQDLTDDERESVDRRFWGKVSKSDGCWTWVGSVNRYGYGDFRLKRTHALAHRVSFAMAYGPVPNGLFVCHRCDNPLCVNPVHLFAATHQDNMNDMVAKGRGRGPSPENNWMKTQPERVTRGEGRSNSKLTDAAVRKIRLQVASGTAYAVLAQEFSVTINAISCVVLRKTWRHVA